MLSRYTKLRVREAYIWAEVARRAAITNTPITFMYSKNASLNRTATTKLFTLLECFGVDIMGSLRK